MLCLAPGSCNNSHTSPKTCEIKGENSYKRDEIFQTIINKKSLICFYRSNKTLFLHLLVLLIPDITTVNFYVSDYFWFLWGRWSLPFTWRPGGEGSVRMNYAICLTITHDIPLIKGERVKDQMLQIAITHPKPCFHIIHGMVDLKVPVRCNQ